MQASRINAPKKQMSSVPPQTMQSDFYMLGAGSFIADCSHCRIGILFILCLDACLPVVPLFFLTLRDFLPSSALRRTEFFS